MADGTSIEWTQRPGTKGASWNPVRARNRSTGKVGWHCTHDSEGCRFCYAETFNRRLGTGLAYKPGHERDIEIFLDQKTLQDPLRWKAPRTIFCGSMTDLFGQFVTDEMLDRIFAVVALCPQHTFIFLTKRADRMRRYLSSADRTRIVNSQIWSALGTPRGSKIVHNGNWRCSLPLPNVWLGVSTEDQAAADRRIPELLATPAAVRFVSAEPLLGPISFIGDKYRGGWDYLRGNLDLGDRNGRPVIEATNQLDWIIVGGESGSSARPMHPAWARSIRDQCAAAGVPFFFKQWGAWAPSSNLAEPWHFEQATMMPDGRVREWQPNYPDARLTDPEMRPMSRVGKKAAGRLLDGREHSEFPKVAA